MKKMSTILIVAIALVALINFDSIVVFILAGAIPAINLVIPATTMLSLMIASMIMIPFVRRRRHVVNYGVALYDRIVASRKAAHHHEVRLPKRRYQEL